MKKILIVEDEPFETQELSRILLDAFPDAVIRTANTASKAIASIEEEPPELIMLDIMLIGSSSGFAVAQFVHQRQLHARVVILTAFEEFEYAQAALRFGISDYLLKPIRHSELLSCLGKIAHDLSHQPGPARPTIWPYIQAGLFEELSGMLPKAPGSVAITSLLPPEPLTQNSPDPQLIALFRHILAPYGWMEAYQSLLILYLDVEPAQAVACLRLLKQEAERIGAGWIRFGLAGTDKTVFTLSLALDRAIKAFLLASLNIRDDNIHVCHLDDDLTARDYPYELETQFIRFLERRDYVGCDASLTALLEHIVKGYGASYQVYLQWIRRFCFAVEHHLAGNGARALPRVRQLEAEPPPRLRAELLGILYDYINQRAQRVRHPLVLKAIEGINAHYHQKLCLQTVADTLHISPVYLSRLFKQETGQTFKDYRTQIRIEVAKKLLADERHSIAEISDMCGYNNPGYFGESFKALTGLTPSEYRKGISRQCSG